MEDNSLDLLLVAVDFNSLSANPLMPSLGNHDASLQDVSGCTTGHHDDK